MISHGIVDRSLAFLVSYFHLENHFIRIDVAPGKNPSQQGSNVEDLPPILERIGITRAAWLQPAKDFETHFCSWIGQAENVERVCQRAGQRWARGIHAC